MTNYIWENDSDLIMNVEGIPASRDEFGHAYETLSIKGNFSNMNDLLFGLFKVYSSIQPLRKITKARKVVFVWRSIPEEISDFAFSWIEVRCRLTVYAHHKYLMYKRQLAEYNLGNRNPIIEKSHKKMIENNG